MYSIIMTPIVKRYFKKIRDKNLLSSYKEVIDSICINPYQDEFKSGDLNGVYCMSFRYTGAKYEIAYIIQEDMKDKYQSGVREIYNSDTSKLGMNDIRDSKDYWDRNTIDQIFSSGMAYVTPFGVDTEELRDLNASIGHIEHFPLSIIDNT